MDIVCHRCNNLHPRGQCPNPSTLTQRGSTRAWRTLRARALRRAGYACEACGAPAVDVHHKTERILGGADTLDNLEALCHFCHEGKR